MATCSVTIAPAAPTTVTAQSEAIEVLFREARRRRRRRWSVGLLLFALVVGALVLGLDGSSSGGGGAIGSSGSGTPSGAGIQPPGTSATVEAEMLDYFFPTDGLDFADAYRFVAWEGSAMAAMTNRCLTGTGFPVNPPSAALVYGGDNTEFPELQYLSQHGFLVMEPPSYPGPNPTRGMSSVRYGSAERRCRTSTSAGFHSLIETGAPLQQQWMSTVTAIDAGPQFQRALVGWRSCTQRAGVDVTTISDFFTYADSQAHGGSTQDSIHLGRIYARCLGPAEAVRDQLRQQARVSFLSNHASAVAELTSMLASLKVQSER